MKTEKGKYYIVYDNDKLIIDLGLIKKSYKLKTLKSVFITDNENDYLKKKGELEDEQEIDY